MHVLGPADAVAAQIHNALLNNLNPLERILPNVLQCLRLQLSLLVQNLNQVHVLFEGVLEPAHPRSALLRVSHGRLVLT